MPQTFSFKIASSIIAAGFFILISIIAISFNNLNTSFYIIFILLAVYLFLFGLSMGQNLARPIGKLLKRADDLSRGDLKSRFYAASKDEVGQLASVFNRIADRLEESSRENEKTKKLVGIKVEVKTQLLKETISALEQKVQNRTLELQRLTGDLEKFKEYTKAKEAKLIELKNQIDSLTKKLGKHKSKKSKTLE